MPPSRLSAVGRPPILLPLTSPSTTRTDAIRPSTSPGSPVHTSKHARLTASQLARLVFGSYSHARSWLAVLHARGVLARFRRHIWPGSQPWRYTLGPHGSPASWLALRRRVSQ
ncbi:MAG: replication-relaxation family protein [Pseudonocardiaceae bacterium]